MSFPRMKPGIFYCMGRIYWSTILLCFLHFAIFVPELPGPLEHRQNDISHNDTVKITLLVFAIYILFPLVLNSHLCCMSGLKLLKRSLPSDGNYWSDQDFQSWLFFFIFFFLLLFSSCFLVSSSCFFLTPLFPLSLPHPCLSDMGFVFLYVECVPIPRTESIENVLLMKTFSRGHGQSVKPNLHTLK